MRKLFAFITALFLLLPAASTNAAQTWQQIHDHIATEMDGVYAIYQSGDAEGAKDAVNNIYYGIYEKTVWRALCAAASPPRARTSRSISSTR